MTLIKMAEKINNQYEIILVNPRFFTLYEVKFPPFAALFLSSSLKKAGYSVKIFDTQVEPEEKLYQLLLENQPLLVGFSIMTGPTITHALQLSQKIKEISPKTKIVWGGPHPTLLPESTLQNEFIDFVVRGEGEKTIVELTQTLREKKDLKNVKGIGYKEAGKIIHTSERELITNWDEEVDLDWEGVEIKNYINYFDNHIPKNHISENHIQENYVHLPLITSRGCPFRCRFCWNLKANKRQWRSWSAEKVIEEIKHLLPYGINYITFEDDNFGVDIQRVEKVLNFLHEQKIKWAFEGFRVGMRLTPELMKFFKETGCHHLSFGAECGTQKMLDYIQKDITVEQLKESARLAGQYKVGTKYSWVIGFPEETGDDRLKMLQLIDEIAQLNPNCSHYIGIFSPYPGSELYQETIAAGWIPPKNISEWSAFREEINLPYIKNMEEMRSISLTCFFKFAADSSLRPFSKSKKIYQLPLKILKLTANLRWKYRWFKFPLEYQLLTFFKKYFSKN